MRQSFNYALNNSINPIIINWPKFIQAELSEYKYKFIIKQRIDEPNL